jgi:hypothetical protein
MQVFLLWQFRSLFGVWPPLLLAGGCIGVLAALLFAEGGWRLKLVAGCCLGLVSSVLPTILGMMRRATAGVSWEHDGLLQVESAIDRVIHGQRIYGVDWSGTPMAALKWDAPGGNPALHHLAYYPLTVLIGVPFRLAAQAAGLGFDYRVVLLAFTLLGLAAIVWLQVPPPARLMLLCAVFLNPMVSLYLWAGRNDIEFMAALLLSLALASRQRMLLAALALGGAAALKPFAWPAVPFFLALLYLRGRSRGSQLELASALPALAALPLLTVLPFLLADARAFWTDIVLYTSGGIADAYPIGGYGFGALLYGGGLIQHRSDAFPFVLVQLAVLLPLLLLTMRAFLSRPTLGRWLAGYAVLLLAFAFFARFFNDNYVGVVMAVLLCIPPLMRGDRNAEREPLAALAA